MASRLLDECKPGECLHYVCGYQVNDSARTFVRICRILDDPHLAEMEKPRVIARVVAPGIDTNAPGWPVKLDEVLWEAFDIDLSGTRNGGGERWLDWEQDAGRIRSSLRMAYGIDWDEVAGSMPYRDMMDMVCGLMESGNDTPLSQAAYYRTAKPPVRNGHNGEEIRHFNELRKHYALEERAARVDRYGDEAMRRI